MASVLIQKRRELGFFYIIYFMILYLLILKNYKFK